MSYLGKGNKSDLLLLAEEMNIQIPSGSKVIDIKDLILKSDKYDEVFFKDYLQTIIDERLAKEKERIAREKAEEQQRIAREKAEEQERIAREKAEEQERIAREKAEEQQRLYDFELEKLRLQIEAQRIGQPSATQNVAFNNQPNFQFKKLMSVFDPKEDDMSLFLNLFQRQLQFLKVEKEHWVAYLLGVLPNEVAQLIAREPDDKAQDFDHIKEILLKRFKLNAEKLRHLFATHRKSPDKPWKDFAFELKTYFEGWLEELKILDFDGLKNLMILDQMKKSSSRS